MRKYLLFGMSAVLLCGCGGDDKEDEQGEGQPLLVDLFPRDGSDNVPVASRIEATISRESAEICRFSMSNTTFEVTKNGEPVDGSIVFFVEGLRVDFTPSGMFEYSTAYDVEVKLECSATASATFTTADAPSSTPVVQVGDAVRIIDLSLVEPAAIADIIRQFLDSADLLVQVLEVDDNALRMLGGEGKAITYYTPDPDLRAFAPGAFLFPMVGTHRPPFFQIEGSLTIPVDTDEINLKHFEISGKFVEGTAGLRVDEGAIRASSPCDDVCAVQDEEGRLQLVCGNRNTFCDEAGDLNLIGDFSGSANALDVFQTITVDPADGATGVAVDKIIQVTLSEPVNASKTGAVVFQLGKTGAQALIEGVTVVETDTTAHFTPSASLDPSSEYTLLVVAHKAQETTFTTAP